MTTTSRALNRSLLLLGTALIAATIVVLAVTNRDTGHTIAKSGPATAVDHVVISNFAFMPARIAVPVGTKITWTNEDSAPHSATSGVSPKGDHVFDTGVFQKGQSRSVTVTRKGTFTYFCTVHPFMKATVVVT